MRTLLRLIFTSLFIALLIVTAVFSALTWMIISIVVYLGDDYGC